MAVAVTYDILDCGPRNRFAANGKLVHNSGGDKQNAQNLNRVDPRDVTAGALRMSWIAPKGHVIVVRDLGQIEARVLVYWAGQEDMIEMFRAGGDPYNFMATKIYGFEVDRKHNPAHKNHGQVGKIVILGAGYQMGAWKLQENIRVGFMGMQGFIFGQDYVDQLGVDVEAFEYQKSYKKGFRYAAEEAEACKPLNVSLEDHITHCAVTKHLIDVFRTENSRVKELWNECQYALGLILANVEGAQVGSRELIHTHPDGLVLPNGMKIRYESISKSSKGEFKYLSNRRKKEWTKIYGGKVTENCIAEGTKVLTNSGWKNIEDVLLSDLVHDGVDFVAHTGLVSQGVQECCDLDGVYMTLDHKVLVGGTCWVSAEDILKGRPTNRCMHPVFDIMNCGPRHRFVVLGNSGPFIVHNCVQALSRLIIADQMLRVKDELTGYSLRGPEVARIVSSTHDEIITVVPERYAEACLDMMGREMKIAPKWSSDLPLKSSGGYARSYGECEK